MSDESTNSITESSYNITLELNHYGTKVRVKFSGNYLKQDKIAYAHGKIVDIYIVYEISKNYDIIIIQH